MREVRYLECDCGNESGFETDAAPGVTVWVQCEHCGAIINGTIPGKYTGRKTRRATQKKQNAIFGVFATMKPRLTIRQIFYQLAVMGIVPKSQAGYRAAQYQLGRLRRLGTLPYGWIADNTRWQIRPTVYNGLSSAMEAWHVSYRRDLWESQSVHIEVWVEKDAIAGVVSPITRKYGVPLYVARGFSSITFVYDAVRELQEVRKPVYIYHFGDFDPSGVSAGKALRDELALHGMNAHFESVAVTLEQVERLQLPALHVNRKDPRAKTWPHSFVCELEALPPNVLRDTVENCITRHIDPWEWKGAIRAEELERQTLRRVLANFVQEQN